MANITNRLLERLIVEITAMRKALEALYVAPEPEPDPDEGGEGGDEGDDTPPVDPSDNNGEGGSDPSDNNGEGGDETPPADDAPEE